MRIANETAPKVTDGDVKSRISPGWRSLRVLIQKYQTDPDSSYHRLRYHTRRNHDALLNRLVAEHGHVKLADIKGRTVLTWHRTWTGNGQKLAMGHSFVGQLRTLFAFGMTILENEECERLCTVLSKMRFQTPKPSVEQMTADQCVAIRRFAHQMVWPSIALAQAFQFELALRQKDVIGEWVPTSEPVNSDTLGPKGKWLRGLRWEEIDQDLILRHTTSKRGKPFEADLKLAPMILEELELYGDHEPTGPVVVCDTNGLPWLTTEFRRKWRILARAVGIPDELKNMHSRAGGITEASDAGADMEYIRQFATHSNVAMTQKYNRNGREKNDVVMRKRIAHRNARGISK